MLKRVSGITEITKLTETTTEITTEITMEITEITIKGWGGGDVGCSGVGRCEQRWVEVKLCWDLVT